MSRLHTCQSVVEFMFPFCFCTPVIRSSFGFSVHEGKQILLKILLSKVPQSRSSEFGSLKIFDSSRYFSENQRREKILKAKFRNF